MFKPLAVLLLLVEKVKGCNYGELFFARKYNLVFNRLATIVVDNKNITGTIAMDVGAIPIVGLYPE